MSIKLTCLYFARYFVITRFWPFANFFFT